MSIDMQVNSEQELSASPGAPRPRRRMPPLPVVFLLFFSYSTAAALIFQNLLLPSMGSLHAANGLLQGDAAYFHSVAVALADKIRHEGWTAWQLAPDNGARGNVAILAALYVVFGDTPSLMVPINAALHALTGILVILLGRLLWPGRAGAIGGLLAASLFIIFPSALNWYGQIHKDGFAIAGTALLLYAWFMSDGPMSRFQSRYGFSLTAIAGIALIVLVRPYSLKMAFVGMLAMLLIEVVVVIHGRFCNIRQFGYKMGVLVILVAGVGLSSKIPEQSPLPESNVLVHNLVGDEWDKLGEYRESIDDWQWHSTWWIPVSLDNYAKTIAKTRLSLTVSGLLRGADSMYDSARLPDSVPALVAFAPRAAQIALFAPFPDRWMEKRSAARLVSIGETLIWYLLIPGVFFAVWLRPSKMLWSLVVFSLISLVVYGTTVPNLGSLYRVRYLYVFLMMLIGACGWSAWLLQRGWIKYVVPQETASAINPVPVQTRKQARGRLFGSGLVVATGTAVTFVGLFLRDVLMARIFGLTSELDSFVAATVGPMLLVSIFSVPIGTAIVPIFLSIRQELSREAAVRLARRIALIFIVFSLALGLLFLMFTPHMLADLWHVPKQMTGQTYQITCWMLVIFLFSGLVTLGNGLLFALGKYVVPVFSQCVVPLLAILVLLLCGHKYGAVVVAISMFVGQLLNFAMVVRALRMEDICLFCPMPSEKTVQTRAFLSQYVPLVASAVFMQLALPAGTAIAAALPTGSVAALSLGGKVVLSITGLLSSVMASVILPYFSNYFAEGRLRDARGELSFLLLIATIATIPLAIGLHLIAHPFVYFVFEGGAIDKNGGALVATVIAYGVLQLPFFVINLLLLKFSIAQRRSARVMLAAMVGLLTNLLVGITLASRLGVAGIALSITISVAVTASFMLVLFCRARDVDAGDMVFVVSNWILYLAMLVCVHYANYPGLFASLLAFGLLVMGVRSYLLQHRKDESAS